MTAHNAVNEMSCNPRAIAGTFLIGVGLGAFSGLAIAIGAHLIQELFTSNAVASQSLVVSMILSVFGGLIFGFGASIGAAAALWISDSRLRRPRLIQGTTAGIGAVVPAFVLLAIVGQTATVDFTGIAWLFVFIFASAFVLMVVRSKAHNAGK